MVFGEDALESLEGMKGRRALVVTDKTIRGLGFVDTVIKHLKKAGMETKVFDEVEPEPSIENVMKGVEIAREFSPDWFVGLGGGSCMDAAKAMWVLYERPDLRIHDITPMTELGLRKKARLACIPTTSGTGSDATWAAVITDKQESFKMELSSRELVADLSVVDPKLTLKMPPQLTAATGMDALTHAIEAYVCQWRNDFSDAMAIKAIQLVFKYLPRAYENGEDVEARERMHIAATMAGMAFSNSQVASTHAMGHAFGAVFHIPHGRAVGLFLPYVMEYSSKVVMNRFAEIAEAVGIKAKTGEEATKRLIECIKDMRKKLKEPLSVKEMGISEEDYEARLDELVTKSCQSACTFVNPRVPGEEDYRRLFLYAFEGKEVDF